METTLIELVSDTLAVAGGNGMSFTRRMAIRVTASGQVRHQPIFDSGDYTRSGTAATFQFSSTGGGCLPCNSDGTAAGTIGGGEITFSDGGGRSYVYRK